MSNPRPNSPLSQALLPCHSSLLPTSSPLNHRRQAVSIKFSSPYLFLPDLPSDGTSFPCSSPPRSPLLRPPTEGKVLLMLGKVQLELQKLVDGYRSHIFQTITIPSKSLLNELCIVEVEVVALSS